MKIWDQTDIELGEIKEKETITVKYTSSKKPDIKTIIPSCGCSSPSYDEETGVLTIKYKPNPVPPHLFSQGFYESTKTVRIRYEDGSHEILSFTSKVKKK